MANRAHFLLPYHYALSVDNICILNVLLYRIISVLTLLKFTKAYGQWGGFFILESCIQLLADI